MAKGRAGQTVVEMVGVAEAVLAAVMEWQEKQSCRLVQCINVLHNTQHLAAIKF